MKKNQYQTVKATGVALLVAALTFTSIILWRQAFQATGDTLSYQRIDKQNGGLSKFDLEADQFGFSVADIGDLNGDGVTDLAVGAPQHDDGGTDRGAVFILFMDADGTLDDDHGRGKVQRISDTDGGFTATLDNSDRFGTAIANIGDLNGDGVTDLAVGVHADDDGGTDRGAVYVLFMDADGTVDDSTGYAKISDTEGGFTATLENSDQFGYSIANIGDLNGDGITDLAVGANFDDDGAANRGAVYVLFMDADGTVDDSTGFAKISDLEGGFTATFTNRDEFGAGLAGIGDLNGDGIEDLAVGAPAHDDTVTNNGAVYILFLDTDGTVDDTLGFVKSSYGAGFTTAGIAIGARMASIGDVNADGVVDLFIANPTISSNAGQGHLLFLDADGTLDDVTPYVVYNTATNNNGCIGSSGFYGQGIAGIGDLNTDGVPDMAVGVSGFYQDTGDREGALCITYLDADGTPDDTNPTDVFSHDTIIEFQAPLRRQSDFGQSVANIGDIDGDGIEDIAVGGPNVGDWNASVSAGSVFILFMDADGTLDDTRPWSRISDDYGSFSATLESQDRFGWAVAGLGDVNSDGVEDIAVGAWSDDDGGSGRGAVYLLFLDTDGSLDATAGVSGAGYTKFSDTEGGFTATLDDGDAFGYSVGNAGDVNGDGVVDLAVGAPADDDGWTDKGAVYLLYLDTDGTLDDSTPYTKISQTSGGFTALLDNGDLFGTSVDGIGDLNGDGVVDLVVGAEDDDDGGTRRGAVYVLFLDADGTLDDSDPFAKISDLDGDLSLTFTDTMYFGTSVADIGDLNGDGIRDIAVGARSAYSGGVATGAVYILYMDEDGTVDDTVGYTAIDTSTTGFVGAISQGNQFGSGVTAFTDLNGDDVVDLFVGAQNRTVDVNADGSLFTIFLDGIAAPSDVTAPVVSSVTITETADTDTTVSLSWEAATDETTAQNALTYKVYKAADTTDLSSVSAIESNGTLVTTLTGETSTAVTGLTIETEYEFNVIVSDEAGNKTAYTQLGAATEPAPDVTAPTVSSGTITKTSETDTTLTFSWTQATDAGTVQGSLEYRIYSAPNGTDLDSVADVEANGTLKTTVTGAGSGTISGLSELTTYAINIIVLDGAGNKALYTQTTGATSETPDTTPPVPGGAGTLQRSSATSNTVTVLWTQATDDETAQSSLVYGLYYAPAGTDMDSVADTEANGTRYSSEFTSLNSLRVTGLTANTSYTFQLIVRDASGNKAVYTQLLGSFTTATASSVPSLSFPANTIVAINEGMECTNTRNVTLDIQGANVDRIVVADDNRFLGSIWELFTGSPMRRSYTLADKEGEQTVYVIFRSWHGNKSFIHSDTIVYRPNDENCTYVATEVDTTDTTTTTTTTTDTTETDTTTTTEIGISDLVAPDTTTTTTTDTTTTTTTTSPSTGTTTTTTTDTATGTTTTETAPTTTTTTSPSTGTTTAPTTTTTTTTATDTAPSANVPKDAIVRMGSTNQYFYIDKAGTKRYPIAEFYIALTWVDKEKIQTVARKDLITIPVDNSLVLAPKPGTLILSFGGKEYWLEPSPDGNPLTPVAREIASQTLIKDIFGKSWNKYRLILTDAQTKGIVIGPAILDSSQIKVDPTTLRTVAELRRLAR